MANFSQPLVETLKDGPMTVADLVGRAYRLGRVSWQVMWPVFCLPALTSALAYAFGCWLISHSGMPEIVIIAAAIATGIICLATRCWLCLVFYGALLFINQRAATMQDAQKLAFKQPLRVISLFIPSIFISIFQMILVLLSSFLMGDAHSPSANMVTVAAGEILYDLIVLADVPLSALIMANDVFVANVIAEQRTASLAAGRYGGLVLNDCGYLVGCLLMFSLVGFFLWIPDWIVSFLQGLAYMFHGNAREVASGLVLLVQCCAVALTNTFINGAGAFAAVLTERQLRIRAEGLDLRERIMTVKPLSVDG